MKLCMMPRKWYVKRSRTRRLTMPLREMSSLFKNDTACWSCGSIVRGKPRFSSCYRASFYHPQQRKEDLEMGWKRQKYCTYDCVTKVLKRLQGAAFQLSDFFVVCWEQFDVVWLFFFIVTATIVAAFAGFVLIEDFKLEYCVTAPWKRQSSRRSYHRRARLSLPNPAGRPWALLGGFRRHRLRSSARLSKIIFIFWLYSSLGNFY